MSFPVADKLMHPRSSMNFNDYPSLVSFRKNWCLA